jgi:RimJ/RimL family protein N-acetyltransferase
MSIEFSTERLLMREMGEDDWQGIHAYSQDERVVYYLDWGPNTEDETKAFVNRAMFHQQEVPRSVFDVAAVLKETNEIIGHGRVQVSYPHYGDGELYCIIGRQHWDHGYGTEAIAGLVHYAFVDLNLHRVHAYIDPENVPTARVMEKNGFEREGHLREHKWVKGIWRDSLVYALVEGEWRHNQT